MMTAKRFLKQYEYATIRASMYHQLYEEAREQIDAVGSTLGEGAGMPHKTGVSRRTEDLVIKLSDLADQWHDAELEALKVKDEVVAVINQVEGYKGQVLYERYINLAKWTEIEKTLVYTKQNLHRLHNKGLDIVEMIINGTNNE